MWMTATTAKGRSQPPARFDFPGSTAPNVTAAQSPRAANPVPLPDTTNTCWQIITRRRGIVPTTEHRPFPASPAPSEDTRSSSGSPRCSRRPTTPPCSRRTRRNSRPRASREYRTRKRRIQTWTQTIQTIGDGPGTDGSAPAPIRPRRPRGRATCVKGWDRGWRGRHSDTSRRRPLRSRLR